MGLAREIARFVVSLDAVQVPRAVRDKLKVCLLNGYGIALGGADTPYYLVAGEAALTMDRERTHGATLLFNGRKTSVDAAVLANSALFHGRAQEDTCGTVHAGAIVIPLLTALIESGGFPIERLESALLAAYEVSGLLDLAFGRATAAVGFRATPLYGTIGAAAAAGKLMGLTEPQMESALANAAAFTGGTLQTFAEGTDEWRYQVGVAARNGWAAAALARAGSRAAAQAFEGSAGFIQAFVRTQCDVERLQSHLGQDWSVLRVTFKPFPVCAFNQTPVTAALELRRQLRGSPLVRIRVRMNPYETTYAGMASYGPFNSISGTLMSIPFCVATTLIHGAPEMKRMKTYDDQAVSNLMAKISIVSDDSVPNLSAIIDADLESGSTVSQKQYMTAADYSYDWQSASRLVRRIGHEQGIDEGVYDRLEQFVLDLPRMQIGAAIDLFSGIRPT